MKLKLLLPIVSMIALTATSSLAQELRPWMSKQVANAWNSGFKGQGTSITVIDDFTYISPDWGDLRGYEEYRTHGQWTTLEARMTAPSARVYKQDVYSGNTVALRQGLNVLNLSYGVMAAPGSQVNWNNQESSIISYGRDGRAVVVKSAGNDSVAVGAVTGAGQIDYLSRDLIGTPSTIFVGALNSHGTRSNPASLASYSNVAGANTAVQKKFLVVGVTGDMTNLYGTSFAAPTVVGYVSILGSKFTGATPTRIANQLLRTARTDTISGYSSVLHGRGEASLNRALAPASIN